MYIINVKTRIICFIEKIHSLTKVLPHQGPSSDQYTGLIGWNTGSIFVLKGLFVLHASYGTSFTTKSHWKCFDVLKMHLNNALHIKIIIIIITMITIIMIIK